MKTTLQQIITDLEIHRTHSRLHPEWKPLPVIIEQLKEVAPTLKIKPLESFTLTGTARGVVKGQVYDAQPACELPAWEEHGKVFVGDLLLVKGEYEVVEPVAGKPASLLDRLRHHITGAIERGEGVAIVDKPLPWHVITISSNRGNFGHAGVFVLRESGEALELTLSCPPKVGQVLEVLPRSEVQPRTLPGVDSKRAKEIIESL